MTMALLTKTASAVAATGPTNSDMRSQSDLTNLINQYYDELIDEMRGTIDTSQLMGLFNEGSQTNDIHVVKTKVRGRSVASVNEDGDDMPFINWGQGWDYNFYTLPYRVAVKHQRRLTEVNNFGAIAEEGDELRDAFLRTVYYQLADVFNRGVTPSNAPFLCPDGMYLIDSGRPNPVVGVPTWSNEEATGALTEDMLFDVQVNAQAIRAHNGDLMPRSVKKFLIPPAYDRVAWRLRETTGTVGTAMNDANWAKGRFNYETVPEFTVNNIFFLLGDTKSKENGLRFNWAIRPNIADINFQDPDIMGKRLRARFGIGCLDPRATWRGARLSALS
jgi:hypothetical protein